MPASACASMFTNVLAPPMRCAMAKNGNKNNNNIICGNLGIIQYKVQVYVFTNVQHIPEKSNPAPAAQPQCDGLAACKTVGQARH